MRYVGPFYFHDWAAALIRRIMPNYEAQMRAWREKEIALLDPTYLETISEIIRKSDEELKNCTGFFDEEVFH